MDYGTAQELYFKTGEKGPLEQCWIDTRNLIGACNSGFERVVRVLVGSGMDPNKPTENGWTPLILASREGHDSIVKVLLLAGAKVNYKCKGRTALHMASREGHLAVALTLLDAGAEVTEKIIAAGKTPEMKELIERHWKYG